MYYCEVSGGGELFVFSRPRSGSVAEHGSARLPQPPTGTDGHPRRSLISLQSGNDPCSQDVAALFKKDARCSPTFSMSSHWRERRRRESRRTTSQHGHWDAGPIVTLPSPLFPHLCFFFCRRHERDSTLKSDSISIWSNFRVSCTGLKSCNDLSLVHFPTESQHLKDLKNWEKTSLENPLKLSESDLLTHADEKYCNT